MVGASQGPWPGHMLTHVPCQVWKSLQLIVSLEKGPQPLPGDFSSGCLILGCLGKVRKQAGPQLSTAYALI